ncbi:MAG TPA: hypothetical protein VK604_25905 [Bryobacteraceae bacterium]|nr:hypothetical protein [Bryobacteraceae bacterium]
MHGPDGKLRFSIAWTRIENQVNVSVQPLPPEKSLLRMELDPVVKKQLGYRNGEKVNILIAFAPFIVFAILERLAGPIAGLVAGALVSLLIVLRDWLIRHRPGKALEIGSVLAREETPSHMWSEPRFIRTNYVITAVWALAFVAMVAADLVLLHLRLFP